jgi:hypothetical protein
VKRAHPVSEPRPGRGASTAHGSPAHPSVPRMERPMTAIRRSRLPEAELGWFAGGSANGHVARGQGRVGGGQMLGAYSRPHA